MSIDAMSSAPVQPTQPIPPKSTTVKTDKPRPHVCATCTRSFARLEHLKRHERSHTKEKPFKCDVCERCFARRDLLLRHRQKLHASFPESPRVRQTKRKTKEKKPAVQQRQQSVANALTSGVNAPSGLSMALPDGPVSLPQQQSAMESPTSSAGSPPAVNPMMRRLKQGNNRPRTMSFSATSSTSYSTQKDIDAWNTQSQWHPAAPPQVGFSTPQIMPAGISDSESNPFEDFFQASDPLFINPQLLGQGHSPDSQLRQFQSEMQDYYYNNQNQPQQEWQAGDTSPQAILNNGISTTDSPLILGESFDTQPAHHHVPPSHARNGSINSIMSPQPLHSGSEGGETNATTVSPDMSDVFGLHFESGPSQLNFSTLATGTAIGVDTGNDDMFGSFDHNLTNNFNQTTSASSSSSSSSSSHVITPQLRLHVLHIVNPTSSNSSSSSPHLPSTLDLQRYVNSYLDNFGKHMPFLHDSLEFTNENMPLALGMAAIGALYTFEHANSLSIFEISRCCIHVYLEQRRKNKDTGNNNSPPPLWLVQSLVLGVIYGLFSNETVSNEIAVAQANAVISLSKSAGLHLSPLQFLTVPDTHASTIQEKWSFFIQVQSRIRTMHVVHTISCLLATSYNVTTTLKNQDIQCGSPCDESLWTAPTGQAWWDIMHRKELLNGSLRDAVEGYDFEQMLQKLLKGQALVEFKVPQFTLLSLIYAQHLDIHERKKNHDETSQSQQEWLKQQKTAVDNSVLAWETTWSLSPLSSLSPTSQFGPLMSDSIPLSLLAHVRAYVDLRRVKEAFWKRDFDQMGRELHEMQAPVVDAGEKTFDSMLEAASYAADSISLWSKHSTTWTLETSVSQTFIHTILSLFDCGLVVSEFLRRLELKNQQHWTADESTLVTRMQKIFKTVVDVVGHESDDIFDLKSNPESGLGSQLSVVALQVVSKILSKSYIWPFALVMGQALESRAEQIRA